MFPYRVQYNESESDVTNYNLFYKKTPQMSNTFEILKSTSTVYPPKNKHAKTFPDTHPVQNSGAHLVCKGYYFSICTIVYIYIYLYLFIYIYLDLYIQININIYFFIFIYIYIYIYININIYFFIFIYIYIYIYLII